MHRNDIKCSFGCNAVEEQIYIFAECMNLKSNIEDVQNVSYSDIYSTITKQKEAIPYFIEVEQVRLHIKKHLLPWGACGQDHCKFDGSTLNYAADVV